jgi:hypothetical protein
MHSGLNIAGSLSLLCAGSGAWLAAIAHKYPIKSASIEYVAGTMLIGGLLLLGTCLKFAVE